VLWLRNIWFLTLVIGGVAALGWNLLPPRANHLTPAHEPGADREPTLRATVVAVDSAFEERWNAESLEPAKPASDLLIARRLSLALTGTVPSLEEIRQFEALPPEQRLGWWIDHLLHDRRYADYFAERFARSYVGTEDGPFILYRRRRFVQWLADEFAANKPYDGIVRELIASEGLWTDHPATNFVSVTAQADAKNKPDPVRLGGRVTRAFLGLRLDCAQCHNHPFASWRQKDFEGLSAYFGQTDVSFAGIRDEAGEYRIEDRKTREMRVVEPEVPFSPELVPEQGTRRQKLAAWVTHPRNPYFARATVNRVWALLFGRPLVDPVDGLEPDGSPPPTLQMGALGGGVAAYRLEAKGSMVAMQRLADDFTERGYDLRRLIRVIASSRVFRLDSTAEHELTEKHDAAWAVFPLTRLRPEQVAGSVIQAASITTIDADAHLIRRLIRLGDQNDFVTRYGDTGEDEFDGRGGTIPQRLILMNGKMVREKIQDSPLNATTRIAWLAKADANAVEVAYLACLSRRPTEPERAHFGEFMTDPELKRAHKVQDLFWSLINATEFSWNH